MDQVVKTYEELLPAAIQLARKLVSEDPSKLRRSLTLKEKVGSYGKEQFVLEMALNEVSSWCLYLFHQVLFSSYAAFNFDLPCLTLFYRTFV